MASPKDGGSNKMDDEWAKQFEAENGRKPTFDEFMAHQKEVSGTPNTGNDQPGAPAQQAAQPVSYDPQTGAPIYAEQQPAQAAQPQQPEQPAEPQQQAQPQQFTGATSQAQSQDAVGQQGASQATQQQPIGFDPQTGAPRYAADTQPQGNFDPQTGRPLNQTAPGQGGTVPPQGPAGPTGSQQPPFDFKAFIKTPKGIGVVAVIAFVILFIIVGKATDRTTTELQQQYNDAVSQKSGAKLLKLFPGSQTKSTFAKDGAQQVVGYGYTYEQIAAGSIKFLKIKESNWLLFFKRYSLSTTTTDVKLAASAKKYPLSYKGKTVTAKDFKQPFFPGSYKFTAKQKSQFGTVKVNNTINAGNTKSATLKFGIGGTTVTLPAGPNTFKVTYQGKDTGLTLKDKKQKVGPFNVEETKAEERLKLSGSYGTVIKVSPISLYRIYSGDYWTTYNQNGDAYLIPKGHVTLTNATLKANLQTIAENFFKAQSSGSLAEFTMSTKDFRDNYSLDDYMKDDSDETYTFKSIDYDQDDVSTYIGIDGKVYIGVSLTINYKEKYADDSDDTNGDQSIDFLYQMDTNGKLTAYSSGY